MTQNELNFYAMLQHSNEAVYHVQDQLHENYNVDSVYDEETNTLKIIGENTLQKVSAKQFVESLNGDALFDIVIE